MEPLISPRVPWALTQWPAVFVFAAFQALLILSLFIIRKRKRQAETECARLAQLVGKDNDERFAKAFKANPQPMSLTMLATGLYLDVNESFLTMSGYTREEVIGHTSLELGIWETPAARTEFVKQVIERGSLVNYETKFGTKDGSLRVLLSSAETFEIGGEACLLVCSSDITERVADQRALRESEERFRDLVDTAPVMIWIVDPDSACTYVNKRCLDFTGRSMEKELGQGWMQGIHADDYEAIKTYTSRFIQRQPLEMEYRMRRHNGEYRWVFDCGVPRFYLTASFSVTSVPALTSPSEKSRKSRYGRRTKSFTS